MENTKDNLDLRHIRWKGLLSIILNLPFRTPKALSIVVLRDECLRLKNSLALEGDLLP
jgi:hypothetical protein